MITVLSYMYRDASNYKQRKEIAFSGRVTDEEQAAFVAHLSEAGGGERRYFLAEQVGLRNLRDAWHTHFEDDHIWHESQGFDVVDRVEPTKETISEFISRFCRTEWNIELATNRLKDWQRNTPVGH